MSETTSALRYGQSPSTAAGSLVAAGGLVALTVIVSPPLVLVTVEVTVLFLDVVGGLVRSAVVVMVTVDVPVTVVDGESAVPDFEVQPASETITTALPIRTPVRAVRIAGRQ